ncbi:bifunctional 5,10-methylenetetrahydrofolate dehydrogenase/5,10-methenyltetrahydrofolate cyclohydrolase [Arthrobacter sp. MYb213]|uniref:bifunctional 5,10-methylenetetrahydrofolate dehydrogenase/5,10-methenyltetrahydrofolate cyclohydrolase n=1 Tax=Arthrobacter sp. MYb213 TaxID=1848595 RepID=UPI000CFDC6AD|nr:bifunctional 5,10-methylenetetrahydrofolate dehydrogenase/5,10-methenyltetrahydrofolate cyclohydrolase [Arthrobacter sp. MYb213]PRB70311.1 bifunctional 5,10-methylene-tetrahydrofolate dehydrogenase/5,10-methylene-tetrahydrofolate cyclohydrolase [Arthrobacter sp. MYb213]
MSARLLLGEPVAEKVRQRIGGLVTQLAAEHITPKVAVIVATDNEATKWYVGSIARAAAKLSVACEVFDLGEATEEFIAETIKTLNADELIHGIILQTPLPQGVDVSSLVKLIDPAKDIDGANPVSLGRLSVGQDAFAPATARSVIEILEHYRIALSGKHVAVIGRSAVVGKPLAQLLLQRDATVTICHSRTVNLAEHTRRAAVCVVAAGQPHLLASNEVTAHSVVIDVGTHVTESGELTGDVQSDSVQPLVAALSPVPGGVGTVTTALLLLHTVQAATNFLERSRREEWQMSAGR